MEFCVCCLYVFEQNNQRASKYAMGSFSWQRELFGSVFLVKLQGNTERVPGRVNESPSRQNKNLHDVEFYQVVNGSM